MSHWLAGLFTGKGSPLQVSEMTIRHRVVVSSRSGKSPIQNDNFNIVVHSPVHQKTIARFSSPAAFHPFSFIERKKTLKIVLENLVLLNQIISSHQRSKNARIKQFFRSFVHSLVRSFARSFGDSVGRLASQRN